MLNLLSVAIFATITACIPLHAEAKPAIEPIEKIWHSNRTAELMGKLVLRAKELHYWHQRMKEIGVEYDWFSGEYWERFQEAQYDIFEDNSREGDCAVVQALTMLNDASGAEDTICAIYKRGKRMLPILEFAFGHPIYIETERDEIARQSLIRRCQEFIKENPNFEGCEF